MRTQRSLSLLVIAVLLPAYAQDLVFTLENKTGSDLVEFYASPSDVDEWEEDILGLDILESGQSAEITIGDGRSQCLYDLRLVWDDGDVTDEVGADLCETGGFTLE